MSASTEPVRTSIATCVKEQGYVDEAEENDAYSYRIGQLASASVELSFRCREKNVDRFISARRENAYVVRKEGVAASEAGHFGHKTFRHHKIGAEF